jgi:ABC-2 type transport system ATP-binding protein
LALRLDGVKARLSRSEILKGLDWTVDLGVTGLVGRNGAGKTTLMRTIAGVVLPSAGVVERDGQDIFADKLSMRSHRRDLGWLPQEPGLPPNMRVSDLVAYAAWLKEIGRRDRPPLVEAALAHANMSELAKRTLGHLSGGQKRRAALAAALVGTPSLLLLDEPTNGLDPIQRSHFLGMVRALAGERTIIVATHLLEDLALVADQWVALDTGRIVGSGRVDRSSADCLTESLEQIRSAITPARIE